MGRGVRFSAWAGAALAIAAQASGCGSDGPGALDHDAGTPIDLGNRPDVTPMDADMPDVTSSDAGVVAYCGRVGNVQNLAHFVLPKGRRAALVGRGDSVDAVFVASRDGADYVLEQPFAVADGSLGGEAVFVTELSFGTYFHVAAAATPTGGACSFDGQRDGANRVTTLQRTDALGARLGDPLLLSDPTFPSARSWVAAVGVNGYAVAWTESEATTLPDGSPSFVESRLRYSYVDSEGNALSDAIVVPTEGRVESAALARGASDSSLVYAVQRDASEPESDTIFVRPVGADGSLSTSPVALVTDRNVLGDVSAIRVTENTVVAWTELTAGLRSDVHVMRVSDDGTPAVERVVTMGTEQGGSPSMSLFGAFHLALAYVGGPSGTHALRFLEFEIDDLPSREAVTIAELQENASVAIDMNATFTRGALGVAWTETTSAGSDAYAAVIGCNVATESLDGGWCEPDAGM